MMIDTKELRQGNLLLHVSRNELAEVLVINKDELLIDCRSADGNSRSAYMAKTDDVQPVDLTPQWLERCGFEGKDLGREEFYYTMDWKNGTQLGFIEIVSDSDGFRLAINENEYVLGRRFHYLHQLQNLYFALTGEELQIKL